MIPDVVSVKKMNWLWVLSLEENQLKTVNVGFLNLQLSNSVTFGINWRECSKKYLERIYEQPCFGWASTVKKYNAQMQIQAGEQRSNSTREYLH